MSEFNIEVVKLGPLRPHPNADALDITKVYDYQVITKRGNFKEGDLAVYIPIDSLVPDDERWHFLAPPPIKNEAGEVTRPTPPIGQVPEKYRIIEAKKLRGIFSQGMIMPLPPGCWKVGDDLREVLGITKYDPSLTLSTYGENESAPKGWVFPVYTDIVGLRRYPDILSSEEEVVLTEKIHGANGRFVHDGERLWVGSHKSIKKQAATNLWWNVAEKLDLKTKLAQSPRKVFFGEVYGQVQDLKYGVSAGASFCCFDVFDLVTMRYLDHEQAVEEANKIGLAWVPILYRGPWKKELSSLAEGNSILAGHVREGFVVKPIQERWNEEIGRVILKRHGEGYLLRKKK